MYIMLSLFCYTTLSDFAILYNLVASFPGPTQLSSLAVWFFVRAQGEPGNEANNLIYFEFSQQ